jgi:hypothetical protein
MGLVRKKKFISRFLEFLDYCGFDKNTVAYVEYPNGIVKILLIDEKENKKYDFNLRKFIIRLVDVVESHEVDWTPCYFLDKGHQNKLEEYMASPDSTILLLKLE